MNERQPICYVIAGPNGAGKTTFAMQYLPDITDCRNFINADLIAEGLSPLDSSLVQMEAGRILHREIESNIKKRTDFAFETTLAGRSYARMLEELQRLGWKIFMFYLWIPSAEFSRMRVRQRVAGGGHDIPDEAIERRYCRTISNLLGIFAPLCDEVLCYDNSGLDPVLLFAEASGERQVLDEVRYDEFLESGNE